MAIFVVAIHTQPLVQFHETGIVNWCNCVVRLAVPYFFICSGFFLFNKIEKCTTQGEKLQCIASYIKRNVKSYLVWSAVYLPITVFGVAKFGGGGKSLFYIIVKYLFWGEQYYSWPLWYLLSSVYAGIAIYLLFRLKINKKAMVFIAVAVYMLSFGIDVLVESYGQLTGIMGVLGYLFSIALGSGRILTGFSYICAGWFLIHIINKPKKRVNVLSGLILIAFSVVATFYPNIAFSPVIAMPAVALFAMLAISNCNFPKFAKHARQLSVVMYYTHMIVFFLYGLVWGGFDGVHQYGLSAFAFTACGCVLMYILLSVIKSKKMYAIERCLFGFDFQ